MALSSLRKIPTTETKDNTESPPPPLSTTRLFRQTDRRVCCIRDKKTALSRRAMSIRTERDERDYRTDHYRIRLETTIIIITLSSFRGVYGYYTIIVRFPSLPLTCHCCYHLERDDEITLKIICIGTRRGDHCGGSLGTSEDEHNTSYDTG